MSLDAFSPTGTNLVVAATTTSGGAVLPGVDGQQLRVVNPIAASIAFVALGFGATPTATTASMPVGPLSEKIFSIPIGVTHVAVILDTGTGNISLQRGYGQ